MSESPGNQEMIALFLSALPGDERRRAAFGRAAARLLTAECGPEEAFSRFFWELAGLDPPVTHREQLFFRALQRIFRVWNGVAVDSGETALKVLKIPGEKLNLPRAKLWKEVRLAYWRQFVELTRDPENLLLNAPRIIVTKKAFDFFRRCLQKQRA